ncbi:hypothetical protein [Salinithrix halophila]|uniref:LPXTG-motif cell wall anchor domain-containing protein n=1 Tax=Salinithrix halophila TaxID=1485204 RepID=A0ABV8JGV1_9BACL
MKKLILSALALILMLTLTPAGLIQAAPIPADSSANEQHPSEKEGVNTENPQQEREGSPAKEGPADQVTTPVLPNPGKTPPMDKTKPPAKDQKPDPKKETPSQGTFDIALEHEPTEDGLIVKASIREITNGDADGTWTFQMGSETIIRKGKSPQQQVEFKLPKSELKAGTVHLIDVRFEGNIQGNAYSLHAEDEYRVPDLPGADNLDLSYGVYHEGFVVNAALPNAERAKGTWTFTLNGHTETLKNVTGVRQKATLGLRDEGAQPGQRFKVRVTFNGKSEGKKFRASNDIAVRFVNVDVTASCTEKGVAVQGELLGAKHTNGNWTLILDGEKQQREESGTTESPIHRALFSKKTITPGEYIVHADYQGTMDNGVPVRLYNVANNNLKADDPCVTVPDTDEGEEDRDKGEKPDDGKDAPSPGKDKETSGKIKNGEKLPETSVRYPTGMLTGGVLTFIGLTVFATRRKFNKN